MNFRMIWIPVVLAFTLVLAGCADDILRVPEPVTNEEQERDVYIRFRVSLAGEGVPGTSRAGSRADGIPDDETPGSDMENKVITMCLAVYDTASGMMLDCVYIAEDQVSQILSDNGLVVPVFARGGQDLYIYAVVNPTAKMRTLLSSGQNARDLAIYSDYSDYWDVIDEFIPGSAGHQTLLETNNAAGIPMTGVFRADGHADDIITIDSNHATKDDPVNVSADVSRVVAKVHVLAKSAPFTLTDGSVVEYVDAIDKTAKIRENEGSSVFSNWIGWIRLSDVRYIPNGMNKSTWLFPHENGDGKLTDLNMDLTSYVSGIGFDKSRYDSDFVYYYGVNLHKVNISPEGYMAGAETFDQNRLDLTGGSADANRYTRGMYCLENYFDTPADGSFFADNTVSIPMVTHLSVAAKLTPRNIVVAKDYADKMDKFVKMYEDSPDKFYRKYGLASDDFSDADVKRWETLLKERYFGESTLPDVYRSDFRIVRALSEKDAADLINWSLMANFLWSGEDTDFEKGRYPAATFYVYDTNYDVEEGYVDNMWTQRYLYLTAGAVNLATDENARIKTYSVPHISGWGYYYTYLDQLGQTAGNVTPYTASQVTRNTYYLVSVSNFGVPGGTITRPEYIKVNTVPVNWVYQGKGDINLR